MSIGAGLAYVGGAVASAVAGAGVTFVSTAVISGIVQGAIVGAVIGGLSSAITGGNILQGVLVGAIGGAVTGGVLGWANPSAFAVNGVVTTGQVTATDAIVTGASGVLKTGAEVGATAITEGAISGTTGNIAGMSSSTIASGGGGGLAGGAGATFGDQILGEVIGTGIKEGASALLGAEAQTEALEVQSIENQKQRDAEMEALDKKLAAELEMAQISASASKPSQQLASTIAEITSRQQELKDTWKREDTAKAKMSAAAKSIGRAGALRGSDLELTDAENVAVRQAAEAPVETVVATPTEAAMEVMNQV